MRSRRRLRSFLAILVCTAALIGVMGRSAVARQSVMAPSAAPAADGPSTRSTRVTPTGFTRSDVERARARIIADPALNQTRKFRTLRWKAQTTSEEPPGWLTWVRDAATWVASLISWIDGTARYVVLVLVAGLVVWFVRGMRLPGGHPDMVTLALPTHVGELDIRPESLPDDIGAAAQRLWESGDHRAALALLYRGLLSRLAHRHRVPILASSTEGDCLMLAAAHATATAHAYATRLVRVWQRSVYGGESAPSDVVLDLCAEFASSLEPPAGATLAEARP